MSDKFLHAWVRQEVKRWVAENLISPAQAEAIAAKYPPPSSELAWGTIIFSSLGAIVTGLGVILLLAYNWAAIPKFGKLTLIFGALAATHAAGLWLFRRTSGWRRLGEAVCLLGTMLFGAGIWLVAQIYHIDEHFPNAFLIWGLGATLMAWALPSIPQAILGAVLLAIWCSVESLGYDAPMVAAPLLIALALGSLAYVRRSLALVWILLPILLLCVAMNLPRYDAMPWLVFSTLLNLAALLIAARHLLPRYTNFPDAAPPCGFYGWGVYLVVLYLLSFPSLSRELLHASRQSPGVSLLAYWLTPFALGVLAWGLFLWNWFDRTAEEKRDGPGFEVFLVPLTALLVVCDPYLLRGSHGWAAAGPINLVYLGLTAAMLARGCRHGRLSPTVLGSVLLVALAAARYFDLFESFLARGLVFVLVGAALFAEGILYARAKKRKGGEAA